MKQRPERVVPQDFAMAWPTLISARLFSLAKSKTSPKTAITRTKSERISCHIVWIGELCWVKNFFFISTKRLSAELKIVSMKEQEEDAQLKRRECWVKNYFQWKEKRISAELKIVSMKEHEEDAQLKRRECWVKNSQSRKAVADDDEGA